ncbi:MAG: bifunctional phosphoglucose/phosphomannose isomerase [Candidatus Moranbacteria bacterium]|jgi:glucose/mannose-6-phosphate isomerase|nr:bifunctional phosphoglucose/phosphomannose isomerase [Candidatus Moranbacteria bacterium]
METNKIDKSNLRRVILDGANQFKQGLEIAKDIKVEGVFKSVTLSGMGGSALPGNVLRVFINDLFKRNSGDKRRLAIYQNRFYSLPPEAYEESLNIICSFSGNTEETVASFEEAIENNLVCVGISSGGKIEQMCKEYGIPHVKLPIPYENFQPRMAIGYFFVAIFQILVNAGLVDDATDELVLMAENLKEETEKIEEVGRRLAEKIKGKTPIIYSSTKFKPVAMIWKIKINENAKTPAFWNFFPELNHNEMVGFTNPQANFIALMLKDIEDEAQNQKRFDVTAEVLRGKNVSVEVIEMEKGSVFYKIFATLYLGDWMSYYLALEYGQDPTPVDMVENFKKML